MKRLLKVLKSLVKKEVVALPERPRKMANKILESNEILHLTKHVIKLILWPTSQDYQGWLKEVKVSLFNNLSFGLCRFCVEVEPKKRYISKLWFGVKEIQKRMDDLMVDAYWQVRDEMDTDPTVPNPFVKENKLHFKDLGFLIKEEKDPIYGLRFSLYYNGLKLV